MAFDVAGLAALSSAIPKGYQAGQDMQQRILAQRLQNQQALDLRNASLASMLDDQGMDPTTATIMALSGGGQGPQQQQPMAPPPQASAAPMPASPAGGAAPSAGDMPAGPGGAAPAPVPTGGTVTPQPAPAGAMPPGGAPRPYAPMLGQQMSLGQMLRRLKADPRNANIPDTTLLGIAAKAQQVLHPEDRMLLQFMIQQIQRQTPTAGETMAHEDRLAQIAATHADREATLGLRRDLFKQGMDAREAAKWQVVNDPTNNNKPFRYNATTGEATSLDGKEPYTPGGISKLPAGASFTPEMGGLMAALAEKGVSLPTGFRSKDQQAALYKALIDRNPGKTPDQIADMVKEGKVNLAALTKEVTTAAGQAGRVQVAANELSEFAPLVLQASAKVPRGKFVPLNKLVQMGDAQISDPNLKELKIYINSLLNAYDQLAARGGTDMEKRREARNLLLASDSPEVVERSIKAFMKEAEAAKRAAISATKVPAEGATSTEPPSAGGAQQPTVSNW